MNTKALKFGHQVGIILLVLLVLPVPAILARAQTPNAPKRHVTIAEKAAGGFSKFNKKCGDLLNSYVPPKLRTPLNVAGHIVPVVPLFKTLAEADKLFFILIESPMTSLLNQPIAMVFSKSITGLLTGGPTALDPEFFGAKFFSDVREIYLSYQTSTTVRYGIGLNNDLSNRTKYILRWWYSAASYSLFTAGPIIASAKSVEQLTYAWSMVGYSMLWPFFSQWMDQYIFLPYIFGKFPKDQLRAEIKHVENKTEDLLKVRQEKIYNLRAKLETRDFSEKLDEKTLRTKIGELEAEMKWIHFYRDGLEDGQRVPFSRGAKFWAIKSSRVIPVIIGMTTIYFLGRWALVGTDKDHPRALGAMDKLSDLKEQIEAHYTKLKEDNPSLDFEKSDIKDMSDLTMDLLQEAKADPDFLVANLPVPTH